MGRPYVEVALPPWGVLTQTHLHTHYTHITHYTHMGRPYAEVAHTHTHTHITHTHYTLHTHRASFAYLWHIEGFTHTCNDRTCCCETQVLRIHTLTPPLRVRGRSKSLLTRTTGSANTHVSGLWPTFTSLLACGRTPTSHSQPTSPPVLAGSASTSSVSFRWVNKSCPSRNSSLRK